MYDSKKKITRIVNFLIPLKMRNIKIKICNITENHFHLIELLNDFIELITNKNEFE